MFVVYTYEKPFMQTKILFKTDEEEKALSFKKDMEHKFERKLFISKMTNKQIENCENPNRDEFDSFWNTYCG